MAQINSLRRSPDPVVIVIGIAVVALLILFSQMLNAGPIVRIKQQAIHATHEGPIVVHNGWSGAIIGRNAAGELNVLTCSHGYRRSSPVLVEIEDGQWAGGRIERIDTVHDLGLLAVTYPRPVGFLQVSPLHPAIGQQIATYGFPEHRHFRGRHSRCLGYLGLLPTAGGVKQNAMVCEIPFIPGESGGAVLTDGKIAGVILATDGTHGFAADLPSIRRFLGQSTTPALPTMDTSFESVREVFQDGTIIGGGLQLGPLKSSGRIGIGDSQPQQQKQPQAQQTAKRPKFYVIGYKGCVYCDSFNRAYSSNAEGLRNSLDAMFDVEYVDVLKKPKFIRDFQVTGYPTFITEDRSIRVEGYRDGATLLQAIATQMGGSGAQPYRRGSESLGQPAAVPEGAQGGIKIDIGIGPKPPEIDWSLVRIGILIQEGALGPVVAQAADFAKRSGKNPRDLLPMGEVKALIAEHTDGKAQIDLVTERFSPKRYSAVYEAAQLPAGGVGLIVLVKSQSLGVKAMIAPLVEKIATAKTFGVNVSIVKFAPIFERTDETRFNAINAAFSISEDPEPATPTEEGGDPSPGPVKDTTATTAFNPKDPVHMGGTGLVLGGLWASFAGFIKSFIAKQVAALHAKHVATAAGGAT